MGNCPAQQSTFLQEPDRAVVSDTFAHSDADSCSQMFSQGAPSDFNLSKRHNPFQEESNPYNSSSKSIDAQKTLTLRYGDTKYVVQRPGASNSKRTRSSANIASSPKTLECCGDTSEEYRSIRLKLKGSLDEKRQLSDLSRELLQEIVSWFGVKSIGRFSAVSKASESYGMNQALWKALCTEAWPSLMPFIRSSVVYGNYRQLYKTRAIALNQKDNDSAAISSGGYRHNLKDYVFTLTFKDSFKQERVSGNSPQCSIKTLSFNVEPDEDGKSIVEFSLPFDVDLSLLTLRGSIYHCATGATVKLSLSEGEAWWIDEDELEERGDIFENQWTDSLDIIDITSFYMDKTHEISVLLFEAVDDSDKEFKNMPLQELKKKAEQINAKCIGSKVVKLNWINAIKRALGFQKTARIEITFGSLIGHEWSQENETARIQEVIENFTKLRA
jgi:hypothetical protein